MRRPFASLCLLLVALILDSLPGLAGGRVREAGLPWLAVGQLRLGAGGICTATLVAPDLLLTAAHCLFERETGARLPERLLSFELILPEAGAAGEAGAAVGAGEMPVVRAIRRALPHPDYLYAGEGEIIRLAHDLALLELETAIPDALLPALPPPEAAPLSVIAMAETPLGQRPVAQACRLEADMEGGVQILACAVERGASGAPVLAREGEGVWLVSVIIARAERQGGPVALASPVAQPVAQLARFLAPPRALAPGAAGARQ